MTQRYRIIKPRLLVNSALVEGDIGNLDEFRDQDCLVRADILQDWIYLLNKEYESALKECFPRRATWVK